MCGLWGVSSNYLITRDVEVVNNLAAMSVIRGSDSAGICVVSEKPAKQDKFRTFVNKQVINSAALMYNRDLQKEIHNTKLGKLHAMMGHSRAATLGNVTRSNAHPFVVKNIIGAHNGTVDAFVAKHWVQGHKYNTDGKLEDTQYQVPIDPNASDSRVLFEKLHEVGLQELVTEIDRVNGAMAITWIDHRDSTLNIYRNSLRPLYFMRSVDGSSLYWASDIVYLEQVKSRFGYMMAPSFVPIQTHFTIPLEEGPKGMLEEKVFPKPKYIPLPAAKSVTKPDYSSAPWYSRFNQNTYKPSKKNDFYAIYDSEPESSEVKTKVKHTCYIPQELVGDFIWSNGFNEYTDKEADAKLQKGCNWCSEVAKPWDTTYWTSDDEQFCVNCIDKSDVQHFMLGHQDLRESDYVWFNKEEMAEFEEDRKKGLVILN